MAKKRISDVLIEVLANAGHRTHLRYQPVIV